VSSARLLAAASVAATLIFGLLSVHFGQDVNWDQRNYHLYNPYAWLQGRLGFDLVPGGRPSFYNPFLHLPFWWLTETLAPKSVAFVLGAVQGGGAFVLIAWLARVCGAGTGLALAAAAIGAWGGGSLGLLGTSFFDNVLGLFALGALLVLLGNWRRLIAGDLVPVSIAGLLVGIATGLKLTMALYALGLGLALLALPIFWSLRLRALVFFGLGGAIGIVLGGGVWMGVLWTQFGNPIFPHLNQVFQSPWAPIRSGHDAQFLPQGLLETVFYPFVFAHDGSRVGEAPFRDIRLALLWIAVLGALAFRQGGGSLLEPARGRFVLVAAVATYVVWQSVFGIYRYAVALEQLAPLALLAALDRWPGARRNKLGLALAAFVATLLTAEPANWGRAPWPERAQGDWVDLAPPKLERPEATLVVMTGYQPQSYAISRFPPGVRFLRLTSSFTNPGEAHRMNDRIAELIARHDGPIFQLVHDHEVERSVGALAHYGLVPNGSACVGLPNRLDQTLLFCALRRAGG